MDRHFKDTGYARWIFFGTIYVACYIAFMVIKGKEFVYQLYIPLDCFTTVAMASFYFYYRHHDAIEKQKQKELSEYLEKKVKASLAIKFTRSEED